MYIDKYIFTDDYNINEGKLKLMCDLLRDDKELSRTIYSKLDSSCKLGVSSVFKSSIFGNIFPENAFNKIEIDFLH